MNFSLLHVLLQTTEIVGKGFEYWGAFGMVIALLVSAIIYLVSDRTRILKRAQEREDKHEQDVKETITLMVKVEERMSTMANLHKEIEGVVKGNISIENKLDAISQKLNGN